MYRRMELHTYELSFSDQDFDGCGFMELTEGDFKELFPGKMGTVKKLIRVQKTVCKNMSCYYICI